MPRQVLKESRFPIFRIFHPHTALDTDHSPKLHHISFVVPTADPSVGGVGMDQGRGPAVASNDSEERLRRLGSA